MISVLMTWLIIIALLELWLIHRVQKLSKLDKTGKIAKFVQTKTYQKLLMNNYYYNYTKFLLKPKEWPANNNIQTELKRLKLVAILLIFLFIALPIVMGFIWVVAPQMFHS